MSDRSEFLWSETTPQAVPAPAQPELRVVGGLHAGARAALQAGDGALTVGADPKNDLVLRDAPLASGTVSTRGQAWAWIQEGRTVPLRTGQCLRLGPVILAICMVDDAWPDEAACDAAIDPSARAPSTGAMATSPADVPLRLARPGGGRRKAPPTRSGAWLAIAALLTVAGGSAVAMFHHHGDPDHATPVHAAASAPSMPSDTRAMRDKLEALLVRRGLRDVVRASVRADGIIEIRGVVADDDALDNLLRAISSVTQNVYPELLTQSEFARRVQALTPSLPTGVNAVAMSGGVLALHGRVAAGGLAALVNLVHESLPEAASVDLDDLRDLARTPLPPAPVIRSVLGGDVPSVILADGRRLLPGGVVGALHLVSIDDTGVTFADEAGDTVRVPR